MNDLGLWFVGIIQPIIAMLKVEGFGPFLALVLGLIGFSVALASIIYFTGFSAKLAKAIKELGEFDTEEEFHDRFEEIDQFFKTEKALSMLEGVYGDRNSSPCRQTRWCKACYTEYF